MGGADFSGSSGSSSDSGPSYDSSGISDSSSNDSRGSSSGDSRGSSSGESGEWVLAVVAIFGFMALFAYSLADAKKHAASGAAEVMYVSELILGIDWHARKALQEKLAALAAQGLGGTAQGRVKMLREVVLALERARLSWLYATSQGPAVRMPAEAEATFRETCHDRRSRFDRELIRNDGDEVTTAEAGPVEAHPEEGPGVVVVSLILVTRRSLAGREEMRDAEEIGAALADRATVTDSELVAIEVVWSPAAEEDRMSTAELEQHYPELVLIDPESIAGRTFCSYCDGAFPMELLGCPHCGAAVGKDA